MQIVTTRGTKRKVEEVEVDNLSSGLRVEDVTLPKNLRREERG